MKVEHRQSPGLRPPRSKTHPVAAFCMAAGAWVFWWIGGLCVAAAICLFLIGRLMLRPAFWLVAIVIAVAIAFIGHFGGWW